GAADADGEADEESRNQNGPRFDCGPPQPHTQLSGRCDSGSCEAAAFGAGATASDDRASSWESASPFLNWASDWPSDRDNSGSFFAPKRKTARISATQRSCGPIIDTLPFVDRHAFAFQAAIRR